mgnify:CR=1 FL=1
MTLNISGGEKGNGIFNINGENEGIGTEMHLSLNGGKINIKIFCKFCRGRAQNDLRA